ncbi:MAG: ABC transporter ATP-binding protein [Acidiferrobacteraceae bacterium]
MSAYLQAEGLIVAFPQGGRMLTVLSDVSLRVARGEFVALIGHSGCGKSTLLNVLAGLVRPAHGVVVLDNREVDGPGPERAVVFQNHCLLPWLTVYGNVRLAVDQVFAKRESASDRHARCMHHLAQVDMDRVSGRYPRELSGGMKQRVGIGRALAMEPKVLLLDEPFGALDALTRGKLQETLMTLHSELGSTVVMVTHDVDEAVLLSDRIILMSDAHDGNIRGTIHNALPRPRSRAAAQTAEYRRIAERALSFLFSVDNSAGAMMPARSAT